MNGPRRVEVLGGAGTVHCEAGLVCWFAPGFPSDVAAGLLDGARSAAAGELEQAVTAALAGTQAACFVLREDAGSVMVVLQGRVVVSEDGTERARGSEGAGLVHAVLTTGASLTVRGGIDPEQLDRPGSLAFDLREGTVPGGGVTLWAAPALPAERPGLDERVVLFDLSEPEDRREPLPIVSAVAAAAAPSASVAPAADAAAVAAPAAVDEAAPAPAPVASGVTAQSLGAQPDGSSATEVVVGAPEAPPAEGAVAGGVAPTPGSAKAPLVRGLNCARGHFNNPRALYCGICGLAMVQNSVVVVNGPRPPLGVLLSDDGNAYSLDGDYVLGRQPEHSDEVAAGRARPVRVDDGTGRISRVHARVALRDWDVVVTDLGSHNGTQLFNPGDTAWRTLRRDESAVLQPGGRLVLGESTFEFQTIQRQ